MTKKALITWGGWDGHEPEQCAKFAQTLLEAEGYDVNFCDNLDIYTDETKMGEFNLIVPCWTMSEISGEQANGLLNAVRNGIGLAGWHGGLGDSFRMNTEYQFMVGGQWVAHPGNILDYKVNIINHNDPITEGINDFSICSEQYFMHVDPGNDVLANSTFTGEHAAWIDGTVMPAVWKKLYGEGKVFYSALGHVRKDFDIPEVSEILRRGMIWASK